MDDVTRRNALKLAAVGVATAGVGTAAAAEQKGAAAHADHVAQLATRIKDVHKCLADLSDPKATDELMRIIHKPGWTTIAEVMLVTASLDAIDAHAKALASQHQALLKAARAVGEK